MGPATGRGNHPELLAWAGAYADAVCLSGLGRTLPEGHSHIVSWSQARIEATVAAVRAGASSAGRDVPPLEALVQVVTVTDDRRGTVTTLPRCGQIGSASFWIRRCHHWGVVTVTGMEQRLLASGDAAQVSRRNHILGSGGLTVAAIWTLAGPVSSARAAAPTTPADVIAEAKSYERKTLAQMNAIWS